MFSNEPHTEKTEDYLPSQTDYSGKRQDPNRKAVEEAKIFESHATINTNSLSSNVR